MKKTRKAFLFALSLVAGLALAWGCASSAKEGAPDLVSAPSAAGKEMASITDSLRPEAGGARTLVVFFSQGSATKRVAEDLALLFGADIETIVEKKTRPAGFFGFMKAGYQGTFGIASPILPPARDPSGYDKVIVLSPVWSWSLCPPVRTWLRLNKGKLPAAAFVTVSGDTEPDKIVAAMMKESKAEPRVIEGFGDKDFSPENRSVYIGKIAGIVEGMR